MNIDKLEEFIKLQNEFNKLKNKYEEKALENKNQMFDLIKLYNYFNNYRISISEEDHYEINDKGIDIFHSQSLKKSHIPFEFINNQNLYQERFILIEKNKNIEFEIENKILGIKKAKTKIREIYEEKAKIRKKEIQKELEKFKFTKLELEKKYGFKNFPKLEEDIQKKMKETQHNISLLEITLREVEREKEKIIEEEHNKQNLSLILKFETFKEIKNKQIEDNKILIQSIGIKIYNNIQEYKELKEKNKQEEYRKKINEKVEEKNKEIKKIIKAKENLNIKNNEEHLNFGF